MTSFFTDEVLPIPYYTSLNGVLGFLGATATAADTVASSGGMLAPIAQARQTLADYCDVLLSIASIELLTDSDITDVVDDYLGSLYERTRTSPTNAYAFYADYSYLGFDDVDVLDYCHALSVNELCEMLDHLALILDTGGVPSGSEDVLHPIPGIHHVVTVPGYPEPIIPDWIALTIRIKIEVTAILALSTKLIYVTLQNSPQGASGFAGAVEPYLTAFAEYLREHDDGTVRASSLTSGSGSGGGGSGSGTKTAAPPAPAPPPGSSDDGTHGGGGGGGGGGSGGPPGGSSPGNPKRNIVLIGMWPPSCNAVLPFCVTNPLPPGSIPGGWSGWQGSNWKNRGFDVRAFCPTFNTMLPDGRPIPQKGISGTSFRVDYIAAMTDFWSLIPPLNPVAVIAVTRGVNESWEFERYTKNLAHVDWSTFLSLSQVIGASPEDVSPYQAPNPIQDNPPDSTVAAGTMRSSTLNIYNNGKTTVEFVQQAIKDNDLSDLYTVAEDTARGAGKWVSEWIGYMCNWYGNAMSAEPMSSKCPLHGSIHIAGTVKIEHAPLLMEYTLDHLTQWLNAHGYPS